MKLAALLLLSASLFGATTIIDLGQPTDPCVGGATLTVPGPADTTARWGTFSCKIPVQNISYVVTLTFQEWNILPARAFSVTLNDQVILARVTMPNLAPFHRSVVAVGADGFLVFQFTTITRSAIISSIELTPLNETALHHFSGIELERIGTAYQIGQVGGLFLKTPVVNLECYRNGTRQTLGVDYKIGMGLITPAPVYIVIAPVGLWASTDQVTCDWDQGNG